MMMGFGFLVMLAILAVPILLIVGLVILMVRPLLGQIATPVAPGPSPRQASPEPAAASGICSHCGAKLQADWAHCPHCGASA
jgi:hypothetical protein